MFCQGLQRVLHLYTHTHTLSFFHTHKQTPESSGGNDFQIVSSHKPVHWQKQKTSGAFVSVSDGQGRDRFHLLERVHSLHLTADLQKRGLSVMHRNISVYPPLSEGAGTVHGQERLSQLTTWCKHHLICSRSCHLNCARPGLCLSVWWCLMDSSVMVCYFKPPGCWARYRNSPCCSFGACKQGSLWWEFKHKQPLTLIVTKSCIF